MDATDSIRDEENLRARTTCIHITLGLNLFFSNPQISLILFSQHGLSVEPTPSLVREPSRWSTDVNLSVTAGQGRASSSAPGAVCSGQANVLSLLGVQDGQRCRSPLPAPAGDGEEERNSTDPQTVKKTWLQTADISSTTAKPSLSRADCLRGCAQRPDCLRLPVNKRQSQQARLQWHSMAVSLFLVRTETAKLSILTPSTFMLLMFPLCLIYFLKDRFKDRVNFFIQRHHTQ